MASFAMSALDSVDMQKKGAVSTYPMERARWKSTNCSSVGFFRWTRKATEGVPSRRTHNCM